jgi:hypothetical protein
VRICRCQCGLPAARPAKDAPGRSAIDAIVVSNELPGASFTKPGAKSKQLEPRGLGRVKEFWLRVLANLIPVIIGWLPVNVYFPLPRPS